MGYKKNDPCLDKAYDDERIFVLLARDPAAPSAIMQWIARSIETQPAEKLKEALDCALKMRDTCDTFRKRRQDEKDKAAQIEKEKYHRAFEEGRKAGPYPPKITDLPNAFMRDDVLRAQTTRLTDHAKDAKSYLEQGPKAHDEAARLFKENAERLTHEIKLASNFANWLDAHNMADKGHNFADLLNDFIKSLPNQR